MFAEARAMFAVAIIAAALPLLAGCSACDKKSSPSQVDLEIAIPLTSEQASAMEGIRAGVRGVSRVDELSRVDEISRVDELSRVDETSRVDGISRVDEAARGAVANVLIDGSAIVEGRRGEVVAGVRTGVRLGRRAAPGRQAPEAPAFAFQIAVSTPEKFLAAGERRLQIQVVPPEDPELILLDVQFRLVVERPKGRPVIPDQEIPAELIQLPDGDDSGTRLQFRGEGGYSGELPHLRSNLGGTVKCWGYNGYGQLGDGTTTNRLTPVPVVGLP